MSDVVGADASVGDWLDAASARRPAPGGGAVAALVGALSAAMGQMTLNYSAGRKANSGEDEAVIGEALAELGRARSLLTRLMEEDQAAFASLQAAKKAGDDAATEAASAACLAVPRAVMAAGLGVLDAAGRVAGVANPYLLSDLEVCGELALAAVRCGRYNVRANLGDLPAGEAKAVGDECDESVARGVASLRSLLRNVEARRGLSDS